MMRLRRRLLLVLCSVLPCPLAWPAVAVIAELGPTHPLAPLLEVFGERGRFERRLPGGAPELPVQLPIRSPGLTLGRVHARPIALPLTRPLFLIGSDAASLDWLANHHRELLDLNAVGMLVDADDADDLATVAALAEGISILPASASDIAAALQVNHYPVLITRDRIEP